MWGCKFLKGFTVDGLKSTCVSLFCGLEWAATGSTVTLHASAVT